ncbi:unnamed protein product [Diatraea saccharalis]|uniref:Uncharacterized protein n=1 Tax=Diatraea saccharalis TaxID=40085 RepID=A0A9N9N0N4_9NEOP|nr:unnamed protein product [Diatraea saccharalis]
MLHPAPTPSPQPQKPILTFNFSTDEKSKPMPDIIQNLCTDAPVDLLTKGDSPLCKKDWRDEPINEERKDPEPDLESDSLSDDDSSHTETAPNQSVPRVEVHDEVGELIQLDSLMLIDSSTENNEEKASSATVTGPTVVAVESESSESCRDATTLALTETELSDWAAESAVLDDCGLDDREDRKRNKNPRTLSGPKLIHDAKNISAISSHVCGRTSPPPIVYSNAFENFEFADEGEQDPSIEAPPTPRNEGYMELVDDDLDPDPDPDPYSLGNDRSINFIERSFSETVFKPASHEASGPRDDLETPIKEKELCDNKTDETPPDELKSPQLLKSIEIETSDKSIGDSTPKCDSPTKKDPEIMMQPETSNKFELGSPSLSESSPPLDNTVATPLDVCRQSSESDTMSQSVVPETPKTISRMYTVSNTPPLFSSPASIRLYSPAICRSASETFNRSNSRSTDSPSRSVELSMSLNLSSGSISPVSPTPLKDTTNKVRELKREREEQTEVVRRLVLERLGSGPRVSRKSTRKARASPISNVPPPVPPPPSLPTPPPPPPPPRPAPPVMSLPVTPSFSDPELARERRSKSIMKSISNYLNKRLGPRQKWASEPSVSSHESPQRSVAAHKSTGALQEAPPVPPPPAGYCPPVERRQQHRLPAEQQAATVAELVQVSAQRDAHQALMAADRRRSAAGIGAGD